VTFVVEEVEILRIAGSVCPLEEVLPSLIADDGATTSMRKRRTPVKSAVSATPTENGIRNANLR